MELKDKRQFIKPKRVEAVKSEVKLLKTKQIATKIKTAKFFLEPKIFIKSLQNKRCATKMIAHTLFLIKYYPKYLLRRPSNALPWRASS